MTWSGWTRFPAGSFSMLSNCQRNVHPLPQAKLERTLLTYGTSLKHPPHPATVWRHALGLEAGNRALLIALLCRPKHECSEKAYIYIYVYIYIYIHIYIYTHTYIHTHICIHAHTYIYIHMHTNKHIHVCAQVCVYIHIYIYIYVCIYCLYT